MNLWIPMCKAIQSQYKCLDQKLLELLICFAELVFGPFGHSKLNLIWQIIKVKLILSETKKTKRILIHMI